MHIVLSLLLLQGVIGAFDTFYYHEWKAKLPARGKTAAPELFLHAGRDFFYAIIFGTLPFIAWQGKWVIVLAFILIAEIVLTLWDFIIEKFVRKELGDVYAGERVTHAIMGIIYGAMIAFLIPIMIEWWSMPTTLNSSKPTDLIFLRWVVFVMAIGVFLSGLRDLYAAFDCPGGNWPWKKDYK